APPFGLASTVEGDARVAVSALARQRDGEIERCALVGFGHDEGGFGKDPRQELGQPFTELGGGIIWGVEEYEVVQRALVAPEERQRVALHHPRGRSERVQVCALCGPPAVVVLDEGGGRRAVRQRLDADRSRARE